VATSLSALTLAYLSLAIPLQLAQRLRPILPGHQLFIILVELYALTWFLLVGATVLTQRMNILGLYWIALWNASLLVAVVVAIFEGLWNDEKASQVVPPREESEDDEVAQPGEQQETEDSETAPLLGQHASSVIPPALDEEDGTYYWWIFQFILSMSAPVINLATTYSIWIGAMPQTIPDGGWVGIGMFYSRLLWHALTKFHAGQSMRQSRYCLSLFFSRWPPSCTKFTVCLPSSSFSSSSGLPHMSGSRLPLTRMLASG
jgi:hypothetical protein